MDRNSEPKSRAFNPHLRAKTANMKDKGIVALPIHYAVIVADEHKELAKGIMIRVFREQTGLTPLVTEEGE